jgi:hypothetical protein
MPLPRNTKQTLNAHPYLLVVLSNSCSLKFLFSWILILSSCRPLVLGSSSSRSLALLFSHRSLRLSFSQILVILLHFRPLVNLSDSRPRPLGLSSSRSLILSVSRSVADSQCSLAFSPCRSVLSDCRSRIQVVVTSHSVCVRVCGVEV